MLTGTETRPKEIVAVPIDRAGIGLGKKGWLWVNRDGRLSQIFLR